MNATVACSEEAELLDSDDYYYNEPVYVASLGGISDYLGARPSEFREVILDAVDALNENGDILEPGTIRLVLTLDGSGTITAVTVEDDTVEVDEVTELLEDLLTGASIAGASAGRTTVTINI
jgi:hypothetical protein